MKKVNSFLTIERTVTNINRKGNDVHSITGRIANGRNNPTETIEIYSSIKNVTFTNFFKNCIEYYEIFLCCYCDFDFFYEGLNVKNVTKEHAIEFWDKCVEVADKMEKVYKQQLVYFLYAFATKKLEVCGNKFEDEEEKMEYLVNTLDYRLKRKQLH